MVLWQFPKWRRGEKKKRICATKHWIDYYTWKLITTWYSLGYNNLRFEGLVRFMKCSPILKQHGRKVVDIWNPHYDKLLQ
jgi:CRISPR/Cas system CMR subunit Cmr6 (Cas7 group RAMP superfamily)